MFLNMHKKTQHDKNNGSMARNDRREDQGLSLMLFYIELYAKTKSFRLTPIRTRAQGSQSGVNNPTVFRETSLVDIGRKTRERRG